MRNLTRILNAVLAIFLALGWLWASLLKDLTIITDKTRLGILIVFSVALVFQQVYLAFPEAADRSLVEARRPVIEQYLDGLLNRYYEECHFDADGDANRVLPCVRVNVMLPTKNWRLGRSHLRIYYTSCPDQVVYTDKELSVTWDRGQGTCGYAWSVHGQMSVHDADDPDLALPAEGMTDLQKEVSSGLKSTISIPVWDGEHNKVVGVLNMDSDCTLDESLLTSESVRIDAWGCSRVLAPHLFPNEVHT